MYQLMVSHNCGISYAPDQKGETLEELEPRMAEFDNDMLRWYVEKDGEDFFDVACGIHKGIFALVRALRCEE